MPRARKKNYEIEPCYDKDDNYIGQFATYYQPNGEYAGDMFYPRDIDDPTDVDPRKPAKSEKARKAPISITNDSQAKRRA